MYEGDGARGYLVECYWLGVTEQAVPSAVDNVPVESSCNFNTAATNASQAENWQFLLVAYSWHDEYIARINVIAPWNDIRRWYNSTSRKSIRLSRPAG
jgi:hypothetical protein